MPELKPADGLWKKIFIAFSLFIMVLMPILSKDYGQTGDEWLQIEYGKDIYNYFTKGDQQALDYNNKSLQYQGIEYYGGLFEIAVTVAHKMFPSVDELQFRHFFNALMGAVMMVFVGLIAFRISRKWHIGLLALLFIFFSPRLFGESMNNSKDIPFACGFVITMYGLIACLQDFPLKRWKHIALIALGFAIAFGIRPAGGILVIAYLGFFIGLYYFWHKEFRQSLSANNNKLFKALIGQVLLALAVGYTIGILAWPWGLQEPLTNPFVSLQKMTNIQIQLRVLFDGVYRMNNAQPWFYEFKWILISNPLIVLAGFAAFIVLSAKAIKLYGKFYVVFILFCALFPILYMIYKHSSVHDTWRHVFFVYTFWVVAAALGFDIITTLIKSEKLRMVPVYVAMFGLLPVVIWTVRSHPNQYVYFNELQGGVKGAFGYYDIDYYQNSGKQAAEWIKKNVKPVLGRKLIVMSNMSAYHKYFEKDTAWITAAYGRYSDRHHLEWDYYVTYPRYVDAGIMQNGLWPPANTHHIIEIDEVPLSVIFKNKSTAGMAAFQAYEKKDYANATALYAQYLAAETEDEMAWVNYAVSLAYTGQIDAAIAAVNKAIALNPYTPEYYDLAAQLYGAKNDQQQAQSAVSKANELRYSQQEQE
jgi:hypothetical protein